MVLRGQEVFLSLTLLLAPLLSRWPLWGLVRAATRVGIDRCLGFAGREYCEGLRPPDGVSLTIPGPSSLPIAPVLGGEGSREIFWDRIARLRHQLGLKHA